MSSPVHVLSTLIALLALSCSACSLARDFELVESYSHYSHGFTQGLEIYNNRLYESSGLYRQSFIAYGNTRVTSQRKRLPDKLFAEGLTILDGQLYLLTWKAGLCLILDPDKLTQRGSFRYTGEGWGLTNDGQHLIMSNGSSTLQIREATTGKLLKTLAVSRQGQPVNQLNELEWHEGLILANQWQTDNVLVIDAVSGEVLKVLDLSSLYPTNLRSAGTDVLNGIAYDSRDDTWLVTGKYWPRIYRLKLNLPERGAGH